MSQPFNDGRDAERIRLVEQDLSVSNDFVRGVVATGAAVRGLGITFWLALLGFAFQQHLPELAVLGTLVVAVFWILDGYYGWLYGEASDHVRVCERLLSNYYNAVSRAQDDPSLVASFRASLRAHRFGLFLSFRSGYRIKQWWDARPTLVFRTLYPLMLTVSVLAIVLSGNAHDYAGDPHPPPHDHGHHSSR